MIVTETEYIVILLYCTLTTVIYCTLVFITELKRDSCIIKDRIKTTISDINYYETREKIYQYSMTLLYCFMLDN